MESPKSLLQKLQAVKDSEAPVAKGRYRFEFSKSTLVSVLVVGVLGLCWIFILGVLVGRGYKPENAVPELAQIIPSAKPPEQAESQQPPTALKPEELQFMEKLSSKNSPSPVVEVDSTKKNAPGQSDPKKPGSQDPAAEGPGKPGPKNQAKSEPLSPKSKPEAEKAAAKPKQDDKKLSQEAAARQEEKRLEKEKAKNGPEETYQVASFPKPEMAKSYQDSLAAKGLRTSLEEATVDGSTVYRVLVHFKGGKNEVKSGLEKTGVKKPILRGKKNL